MNQTFAASVSMTISSTNETAQVATTEVVVWPYLAILALVVFAWWLWREGYFDW